jgi:hypothetical protein
MPLQTAKDFANAAANMGLLATQFKPDDSDPYAQLRKLIQFHLISAANKAREIAEALAQKEAQG